MQNWSEPCRCPGWVDVDLSEKGLGEAKGAGELLKAEPVLNVAQGAGGWWKPSYGMCIWILMFVISMDICTHTDI